MAIERDGPFFKVHLNSRCLGMYLKFRDLINKLEELSEKPIRNQAVQTAEEIQSIFQI